MKNTGWHNESKRHSLASQGIKTGSKLKNYSEFIQVKSIVPSKAIVPIKDIEGKSIVFFDESDGNSTPSSPRKLVDGIDYSILEQKKEFDSFTITEIRVDQLKAEIVAKIESRIKYVKTYTGKERKRLLKFWQKRLEAVTELTDTVTLLKLYKRLYSFEYSDSKFIFSDIINKIMNYQFPEKLKPEIIRYFRTNFNKKMPEKEYESYISNSVEKQANATLDSAAYQAILGRLRRENKDTTRIERTKAYKQLREEYQEALFVEAKKEIARVTKKNNYSGITAVLISPQAISYIEQKNELGLIPFNKQYIDFIKKLASRKGESYDKFMSDWKDKLMKEVMSGEIYSKMKSFQRSEKI